MLYDRSCCRFVIAAAVEGLVVVVVVGMLLLHVAVATLPVSVSLSSVLLNHNYQNSRTHNLILIAITFLSKPFYIRLFSCISESNRVNVNNNVQPDTFII